MSGDWSAVIPVNKSGKNGFVMMTYVKGRSPLPPGEGARSAGEGAPTQSLYHPHPAFGHPLPEGEGTRLLHVTVIANYNSLSTFFQSFHLDRPHLPLSNI